MELYLPLSLYQINVLFVVFCPKVSLRKPSFLIYQDKIQLCQSLKPACYFNNENCHLFPNSDILKMKRGSVLSIELFYLFFSNEGGKEDEEKEEKRDEA